MPDVCLDRFRVEGGKQASTSAVSVLAQQKIAKVLKCCMSEVQGMYYLCCESIVTDHLTAQLLCSCSELFWHMQRRFPHYVGQMHHVQIRDLRVHYGSPFFLLIGDCSKEIP